MKQILLATAALLLGIASAQAQAPTNNPPGAAFSTNGAVGQTKGGAINQAYFNANSDANGFNDMALTPALVVPATSTTQSTGPISPTGASTLLITRTTVITTCSSTTGVTLPSVQRYVPITVINRSGGSCLVWPTIGATVETALGTNGAVNAPFTMLTNTDVTFRPINATTWVQ